jgi:hypothetical protein
MATKLLSQGPSNLRNINAPNLPSAPNLPVAIENASVSAGGFVSKKLTKILIKAVVFIIIISVIYVISQVFGLYKKGTDSLARAKARSFKEKCNPKNILLAGRFGFAGNPITNAIECGTTIFNYLFMTVMEPFIHFFEKILDVIVDLVKSVQNIRKMIDYLRDSIRSFLLDIADMFYAYATKFSLLFNRLLETFSKVFLVFEDLFFSLGYSIYTVSSLWNSPFGDAARYFCLHPDTQITMKDGNKIIVSKIKVGDKIKTGGTVQAVHTFTGKNVQMYSYKNKIIIASSHLVLEDGKWIRMENSKFAVPVDKRENTIYCLTTEKGKIYIEGDLFADYMENENSKQMTHILNLVMTHLNNKPSNLTGENEKVWGFHKDTFVKLKSELKNITDIKIGDDLGDNNFVEGITKIYGKVPGMKLFNYNGVICSGNVIVKKDNSWELIKNVGFQIPVKKSVLYHIVTTNGDFIVKQNNKSQTFRDYDQAKDEDTNDKIDEYIESILNKNIK